MAVFTTPQDSDLELLQQTYGLSGSLFLQGIQGGIENSNFRVYRNGQTRPEWVLTLVETADTRTERVAGLQAYLAATGLPVPAPVLTRDRQLLCTIQGRPALLYPCLRGAHPVQPAATHCDAIGVFLAQLHQTPWPEQDRPLVAEHNLQWIQQSAEQVRDGLPDAQLELLDRELQFQDSIPDQQDHVICHGDLFHDNALFAGQVLTGVIDWHNAGSAPGLFDLGIACSDWCRIPGQEIDLQRMRALLQGYCRFSAADWLETGQAMWPFLRRAALRFWLSRLQQKPQPAQGGAQVSLKDPEQYRLLLESLQQNEPALLAELQSGDP